MGVMDRKGPGKGEGDDLNGSFWWDAPGRKVGVERHDGAATRMRFFSVCLSCTLCQHTPSNTQEEETGRKKTRFERCFPYRDKEISQTCLEPKTSGFK